MAWESEISEDESCKISYHVDSLKLKIQNIVEGQEETDIYAIDEDAIEEIQSNLHPGFKAGKWMILIARIIHRVTSGK